MKGKHRRTNIHTLHPYYSFVVATLTCNGKTLVHMSMSVQIYSCRCHHWGCWSLPCGCSLLPCGRWLSGEKSPITKSSTSLWRWWRPQSQTCSAQSSGADCFSGWERKWVSGVACEIELRSLTGLRGKPSQNLAVGKPLSSVCVFRLFLSYAKTRRQPTCWPCSLTWRESARQDTQE